MAYQYFLMKSSTNICMKHQIFHTCKFHRESKQTLSVPLSSSAACTQKKCCCLHILTCIYLMLSRRYIFCVFFKNFALLDTVSHTMFLFCYFLVTVVQSNHDQVFRVFFFCCYEGFTENKQKDDLK